MSRYLLILLSWVNFNPCANNSSFLHSQFSYTFRLNVTSRKSSIYCAKSPPVGCSPNNPRALPRSTAFCGSFLTTPPSILTQLDSRLSASPATVSGSFSKPLTSLPRSSKALSTTAGSFSTPFSSFLENSLSPRFTLPCTSSCTSICAFFKKLSRRSGMAAARFIFPSAISKRCLDINSFKLS